jgi:hypothetical protein
MRRRSLRRLCAAEVPVCGGDSAIRAYLDDDSDMLGVENDVTHLQVRRVRAGPVRAQGFPCLRRLSAGDAKNQGKPGRGFLVSLVPRSRRSLRNSEPNGAPMSRGASPGAARPAPGRMRNRNSRRHRGQGHWNPGRPRPRRRHRRRHSRRRRLAPRRPHHQLRRRRSQAIAAAVGRRVDIDHP